MNVQMVNGNGNELAWVNLPYGALVHAAAQRIANRTNQAVFYEIDGDEFEAEPESTDAD